MVIPPDLLNCLEPQGAVTTGARENNAKGPFPLVLGKGAQEVIDGKADPSYFNWVCHLKNTVEDTDVLSGGIEINVVWFYPRLVFRIRTSICVCFCRIAASRLFPLGFKCWRTMKAMPESEGM